MNKKMKGISDEWALIALFVALVVISLLGCLLWRTPSGEDLDAMRYCRMVHNHDWPDYNGVYARQCNADGTVNWKYVGGDKP